MTVAVAALARPTFDVEYSTELASAAFDLLRSIRPDVVGSAELLMDDASVAGAAQAWEGADVDLLVLIQASFADSTLAAAAAATTDAPILLWAAPEPRTGGRLRRNSFCGINLAGYVLKRAGRPYDYVVLDPDQRGAREQLSAALAGPPLAEAKGDLSLSSPHSLEQARAAVTQLQSARIGIVGERPAGFEPCDFDAETAAATLGVAIQSVDLDDLFEKGRQAEPDLVQETEAAFAAELDLTPLNGATIEPSVRLHLGLAALRDDHDWAGLATRCWPECFTEFGGAACRRCARPMRTAWSPRCSSRLSPTARPLWRISSTSTSRTALQWSGTAAWPRSPWPTRRPRRTRRSIRTASCRC